jgi:thioredoxin-like negative regulator of GroEL
MGRKSRAKQERRNLAPEARLALVTAAKSKRDAPPDKPVKVTDATFDSVVGNSDLPVLVDFWASWCRPCKMVAPILDQLASEMQGELKIAKYNTEENQRVAQALNIRSLP